MQIGIKHILYLEQKLNRREKQSNFKITYYVNHQSVPLVLPMSTTCSAARPWHGVPKLWLWLHTWAGWHRLCHGPFRWCRYGSWFPPWPTFRPDGGHLRHDAPGGHDWYFPRDWSQNPTQNLLRLGDGVRVWPMAPLSGPAPSPHSRFSLDAASRHSWLFRGAWVGWPHWTAVAKW